jgi:GDP-L-fucose synthase
MPTNLYGPNDNFDLETSHVLPAMIRKFHLAKLDYQSDLEGIQKDEQKYGTISEEIKLSMGLKAAGSDHPKISSNANSAVLLWGSGNPRREFLHVDDLADACIFLTQMDAKSYDRFFDDIRTPLINIGCGTDQTVKEIAAVVAEVVGYKGNVKWDQNKPDGTSQKLLDISMIKNLGWKPKIALKDGIRNVYKWYLEGMSLS